MEGSSSKHETEIEAAEDVGVDYSPFMEATKKGDWSSMEQFISGHHEALSARIFPHGRTALHYVLVEFSGFQREQIGKALVNIMTARDLEITDSWDFSPLGRAVGCSVDLLKLMVNKNPDLPNYIGTRAYTYMPVHEASHRGFKDETRYLYGVTDNEFMISTLKQWDRTSEFLRDLIRMDLFDIASDLVQMSSEFLGNREHVPLSELVSKFEGDERKIHEEARCFLHLVCSLESYSDRKFGDAVYIAMGENPESGCAEFIKELLTIEAHLNLDLGGDLWKVKVMRHAVQIRNINMFNLIYPAIQHMDLLLSYHSNTHNNILHDAAELAPSYVLNRKTGAVLQMQFELQWFQRVWNLAYSEGREARNNNNFTPRELLTETHKHLMEAGEKSMKEIAQSCTVVGALIVTIMFAAAFTLPGGTNQNTGLPFFLQGVLFKVFIISDAISLYSSTTSVLACLGILTSRYAQDDFVINLPKKLMIGLSALFFSITTMMVAFCAALAMMLDGKLQLVLPIVLLAWVPIGIFLSSTLPLLYDIYVSTYGPDIFDNIGKLPQKIQAMIKPWSTHNKTSESMV